MNKKYLVLSALVLATLWLATRRSKRQLTKYTTQEYSLELKEVVDALASNYKDVLSGQERLIEQICAKKYFGLLRFCLEQQVVPTWHGISWAMKEYGFWDELDVLLAQEKALGNL